LTGLWKIFAYAAAGWLACLGLYWFLRANAIEAGLDPLPGFGEILFRGGAYTAWIFAPFKIPAFALFEDLGLNRILAANAAGFAVLGVMWFFRRGRLIPAAAAAMCLFILPAVFSNRFQPQRAYLPVFFLSLAAAETARKYYGSRRMGTLAVLGSVVVCLGAVTFRSLDRFGGPEAFWNSVISVSPSCPEAAWALGYTAHLRGDTASAEKYYLRVIELNPREPDARNNLGIIYKNAGRYDEALKFYEGELALNPKNGLALGNIGNLLAGRGDWARAAEFYKRRAAMMPDDTATYKSLVFCLIKAGRQAEADSYMIDSRSRRR
jgi:tetratricopeptide (TPR) repeat protein